MEAQRTERGTMRELFARALNLPAGEREAFLTQAGLSTAAREELSGLLDADADSETFLDEIVTREQAPAPGIGQRFGPFETRELLGTGGMGAVFKAERADGEVAQTVAIKVVERGWFDPRAVERFRRERELLARLEHPNIARLIDGGTRADGVAYLIMEYVEGLALDRYCDERGLAIADRLQLFLPLCDAVDYAHQKLIVHRDLKPSNVLVTAAGAPKLLDFGIARTLDATPALTQTIALTPEFASPEQIRGEEATTRTDVYGLGGVLYFLLTGRAPHAFANRSAAEVQRAILEEPPARPSQARAELKGDLENILLKALHADPRRRYSSARELAEDVESYLARRPVRATPDGAAYRTKRFLQRHAVASAAAAVALVAIVAGGATSLYQAHRAQRRFAEVRELADHFVFDFEAAIRDTPGTLAARRMVAATARQYLAELAADTGRDAGLNRELAQSYYRLSRVEMSAGESPAALEHLRKGLSILQGLGDHCCGPVAQHAQYIQWSADLARELEDARSPADAAKVSAETLANARAWYGKTPQDLTAGKALVSALSTAGNVDSAVGRTADSAKVLEEAVVHADALLKRDPSDDELGYMRARAGNWLANSLTNLGNIEAARTQELTATEALDLVLARHPDNVRWRILRAQMATAMAGIWRRLAQTDATLKPKVLEAAQEAYRIAAENARQNPGDKDVLDTALVMTTRLGNQLVREDRTKESLPLFDEGVAFAEELARTDPANRRFRYLRAQTCLLRGAVYNQLKDWKTAAARLPEAERLTRAVVNQWPSDLASVDVLELTLMDETIALRHLGRLDEARAKCTAAFQVALQLMVKNKDAKNPVSDLEVLRSEARELSVPDPTLPAAK